MLRARNVESTFTLPNEKAKNKQVSLLLEGEPKLRTLFFEVAQTVVLYRSNLIVWCPFSGISIWSKVPEGALFAETSCVDG